MSYAEYVIAEKASEVRHEFVKGAVYAMAGGTPEHGALAASIIREIGAALRGIPCRVYSSDVRIRSRETDLATYPDASVVCGRLETDSQDPDAILNPMVLVEVLSPSTEAHDRGAKWAHYRRIASLREYVLVAQDERLIELYRKNDQGRWELYEGRAGERITLESLGIELDVNLVYDNPLPS
jgi:Uma2 family endonuclease